MSRSQKFGQAIGEYTLDRGPVLGAFLVLLALGVSWVTRASSLAQTKTWNEAIALAVRSGDYELAESLYRQTQALGGGQVLGAQSELEELVYPREKLEREIARYEALNAKYPGHRDILVGLARLYEEMGDDKKSGEYWQAAKALDPNNPIFQP